MADMKNFNVRLKLKYDSYEDWMAKDPVLLEGEVACCAVTVKQAGIVNEVPSVLFKVGDGAHKFSELDYAYAKAADVLEQAKDADKLTSFINDVISSSGLATNGAMTALSSKVDKNIEDIGKLDTKIGTEVAGAKSYADQQISAALAGYYTKGEVDTQVADAKKAGTDAAAALEEYKTAHDAAFEAYKTANDAAVAGKAAEGHKHVKADITDFAHTHEIGEVNGLQGALDAKATAANLEALAGKVGEPTTGKTIVQMIADAQTAATYDDTEVKGDIAGLKGQVGTGTVDERITAAVSAEADRAAAAEDALSDRLDEVEAFFDLAEGEKLDTALDTLVEIQKYITDEGAAADQMVLDIAANAKAIEDMDAAYKAADGTLQGNIDALAGTVATKAAQADLETLAGRVTTAEGKVTTLEGEMDDAQAAIEALQGAVGATGSVATAIGTAKQEAIDAAAGDATAKANQALADAKSDAAQQISAAIAGLNIDQYATNTDLAGVSGRVTTIENELNTETTGLKARMTAAEGDIDALETEVAKKANDADLHAIAKSGNIDDLVQTAETYIIFDCGTAEKNI